MLNHDVVALLCQFSYLNSYKRQNHNATVEESVEPYFSPIMSSLSKVFLTLPHAHATTFGWMLDYDIVGMNFNFHS